MAKANGVAEKTTMNINGNLAIDINEDILFDYPTGVEKVEKETDYHFDKVVKGTIRFIPNEPEDDTSRWIKVSNDGFVTAYRCGIGKGCFAVRSWTAKNVQDWLDGNTEACYDRAVWL